MSVSFACHRDPSRFKFPALTDNRPPCRVAGLRARNTRRIAAEAGTPGAVVSKASEPLADDSASYGFPLDSEPAISMTSSWSL